MNEPTSARLKNYVGAAIVGILLTIALALVLMARLDGRATDVPNASNPKLNCASYTPSHDGHIRGVEATRTLVRDDLVILAARFNCVRTYSVSEGLDEVPKVARELGLKVMLGCWIGADMRVNRDEIHRGADIANRYSDVVTSMIIGNEVLLRRELTAAQLSTLMQEARAATKVPITYADVWEFWLRNPKLVDSADFVTIHILPYWEDNPVPIEDALDHVKSIYAKVRAAFPGKTVFLGETGWPSAGRQRIQAVPSLINEAQFIREFVAYAEQAQVPYNIIEAFDQPWKRIQEGTVGGFWGLYSATGEMKFAFEGPIVAQLNWRNGPIAALIGAALFALIGWLMQRKSGVRSWKLLAFLAISGHIAGSVLVSQWRYLVDANRGTLEWLATSTWAFSGWGVYVAAIFVIARWLYAGMPLKYPAMLTDIVHSWGYGKPIAAHEDRIFGALRVLFMIGLAYVSLSLVYDGRGRDFPITLIGLPILSLLFLEVAALSETNFKFSFSATPNATPAQTQNEAKNEECLLALCAGLAPLYIIWNETWVNAHAVTWCLVSVVAALALFSNLLRLRGRFNVSRTDQHQRPEQQANA